MSQKELAERVGVSRDTIIAIEQGDTKVAIGSVFESAMVVGVPLLYETTEQMHSLTVTVGKLAAVLPQRSGRKKGELDNEF